MPGRIHGCHHGPSCRRKQVLNCLMSDLERAGFELLIVSSLRLCWNFMARATRCFETCARSRRCNIAGHWVGETPQLTSPLAGSNDSSKLMMDVEASKAGVLPGGR